MTFPQYQKYKDSGIEWLGEIPGGWEAKRLKYCAPIVNDKTDGAGSELPYTGLEHIESWTGRLIATDVRPESDGQTNRFYSGDILFGKLRPYLAKVFRTTEDGICTGELLVLCPKQVVRDYLFYYMVTRDFISIVDSSTYGAKMPRANWDFIGNLPVLLPSQTEQRAIAVFLDRETARIDALIEKKQRQIELLQERRSALISHAVTKGLDPNVKMKDSGIEWLGEIPGHWDVQKLKFIASVIFSNVDKHSVDGEHQVRLCNYVDVYYNDHITPDLNFMEATATPAEIVKFALRQGDVLITKDSEEWSDIAVPAYVPSDIDGVLCGYHLARVRPKPNVTDGNFLFRSFAARGINDQFRVAATGVTRFGLGKYWLDSSLFPVPQIDEQRSIAAFLDRETARIDAMTKKIQESIDMLREYRTALISAAVTGKIDVHGEAA